MIYESNLFPDRLKALVNKRGLNSVQLGERLGVSCQAVRNC